MPTLYRLVKAKFADSAFSGEGARLAGGRWNSKGRSCVYLGSTIALCVLEMLVHLQDTSELGAFALFELDVPDDQLMELNSAELPKDWASDPAPQALQEIGDAWLAANECAVLLVPSSITGEHNAILNPANPGAAAIIATAKPRPFPIDARLGKAELVDA